MNGLNTNGSNLVKEIGLALEYNSKHKKEGTKSNKNASSLAFAYEKARNAVEYRDEHLIRLAAIERILKRRLFLNQTTTKISTLLAKELTWARYTDADNFNADQSEKFIKIIDKYRTALKLLPNSDKSTDIVGLCACEIDQILNFNPINQIIINFVASSIEASIEIDELDKFEKNIQVYIATERSFAKNSEILIKHKLLKVLSPNWDDSSKMMATLIQIDNFLNHKHKNLIRRKVAQMVPPFNLIRDFVLENTNDLEELTKDKEKFIYKSQQLLDTKYKETKNKVVVATKRSIVYIFLTKIVLAILIEVPLDILFGHINYLVLSINVLFPPSLMILFGTRVKLPSSDNSVLMINKSTDYLYQNDTNFKKESIKTKSESGPIEKVFYFIFLATSVFLLIGIIYLLNLLTFSFVNQLIFLFFLSVVSFFAFRVREISDDYLLPEAENDSFFETLLDYIFLPIIKAGQWLSGQITKVNVLSFIFDFIIEAPLKTFIEIFEQWLHFVRVKKDEFLG